MHKNDPWTAGSKNLSGNRSDTAQESQADISFQEALLGLDHKAAPVFAVLDGAQFDDLPRELLMGGFVSRSLYLDRGDNNPDQIVTAPHMVWLDERSEKITGRAPKDTIPALLNLIADRPAAVFWQCPAGANALYKHLRSINMVLYPKEALDDRVEVEVADGDTQSEEKNTHIFVLFRHADANVIAQVLPAMSPTELAQLYGPASVLAFAPNADWIGGQEWVLLPKPDDCPPALRGPLVLSLLSVQQTEGARLQRNRRRIMAYLRSTAPEQTVSVDDAGLCDLTNRYMNEARSYGVRSEAGMGRWCYLQLITGGKLTNDPNVHRLMSTEAPGVSADQRVRLLLQQSAAAVRETNG